MDTLDTDGTNNYEDDSRKRPRRSPRLAEASFPQKRLRRQSVRFGFENTNSSEDGLATADESPSRKRARPFTGNHQSTQNGRKKRRKGKPSVKGLAMRETKRQVDKLRDTNWEHIDATLFEGRQTKDTLWERGKRNRTQTSANRKRVPKDSEYGAQLRFLNKLEKKESYSLNRNIDINAAIKKAENTLGVGFEEWKRGREAQHLIPASLGIKLGLPDFVINSPENFMMLPEGNRSERSNKKGIVISEDPRFKGLSKNYLKHKGFDEDLSEQESPLSQRAENVLNKSSHIKMGIDHPRYDLFVTQLIEKMRLEANMRNEPLNPYKVMEKLREMHKSGHFEFVDNMLDGPIFRPSPSLYELAGKNLLRWLRLFRSRYSILRPFKLGAQPSK